ncbi:hypothetical protein [Paraburkholderia sp. BL10I2N1]|nr:hypothetical protein [Paraburkholderia sp. BL10I2N1]
MKTQSQRKVESASNGIDYFVILEQFVSRAIGVTPARRRQCRS